MRTPLMRKARHATVAEGYGRASRTGVGLLSLEARKVLEDFHAFEDPAVRAAFAHRWIVLVAQRFEQTWPVFYQLLKQVETQRLYAVSDSVTGQVAQPTFQAYWEATTGKAFESWSELEQTYTYCCTYKPEMIHSLYTTALKAKRAHDNQEAAAKREGLKPGRRPKIQYNNENNVLDLRKDLVKEGNSREASLRRLKTARPDLHALCLAGELTANAAMVQAGFRKPRPSRKRTPLDYLHIYWRQVSPEDRLRFLTEMLQPHERRALLLGFDEEEEMSPLILHLTPQPDGGYVVTSPTHPALLTEGDTVAEALEHAKDAYAAVGEMEEDTP